MCGRYTVTSPDKIKSRFRAVNKLPELDPSWNVAPSQLVPTVMRSSPNKITLMKWGLLFGKSSKFGTINIRSETIKEKPFFKHFLLNKRCLIIADSFYEWGEVNLEGKNEKYPFNFYLKDRKLFGFAGIYNDFADAEGKPYYTCAIITTTPNKKVARIHNRMPAILSEKNEDDWLEVENKDFETLFSLLKPYSDSQMSVNIVSKRVNNPANDDVELIKEFKIPNTEI
jgi:putative SOS response-associated peptidase YedK